MKMTIMETIGNFSNIAGAVSGIGAFIGVLRLLRTQARMGERVKVILQLDDGKQDVPLPLEMLRRDVSRSELLGRLGMLPMRERGARFSIRALSTPAFMRAVNQAVEGKASTLVIPVTKDELEQFELQPLRLRVI